MTLEHALYNIKRGPHGYAIGKFDRDLNLLAAYNTSTDYCSCPAGPRPTCRHRKMLPRMLAKVDQPEFYCYETQTWHNPFITESAELPIEPLKLEGPILAAAGGNKVVQEQLVEGAERTATQVEADMKESFANGPDSSKVFEPLIDETLRLAQSLALAAPTIRRR